jgi:puromycin-sensitive aminopeptidase
MPANDNPYRLPAGVVPIAYRLRLEPDLDGAVFDGTVEIDVEVASPTTTVMLNAVDLDLESPTARGADLVARAAAIEPDVEHERVALVFDGPLEAGAHTLAIRFHGVLNDQLVGFYRSTFTDESGTAHTIATTQFEATEARRAFPCFDEPALKATFAVTLVVPEGLAAFSNGRVLTDMPLGDGRREVAFATTMRMSTYLVAVVVGPFESTAPVDVGGVPLAVVYPPGKGALTGFALDAGAFALQFFADWFGIPYPGDKVDLVAIPDFAYGAMENLGCVTFREIALLVDEQTASQDRLVRVASVIAHELAHMWFGDLVTMAWWEGLWLNEAFATFMQYLCTDAYRPEWKMWVRYASDRELGLMIDALHTTRSIEFPVVAPAEAILMADPITYQKGLAVLTMLDDFLGAETFRDGIRHYLRTHAYANTVTRDLWDALESASGVPVGDVMDGWIFQGGHPVVRVGDDGVLSQSPFTLGPPAGPSAIGGPWSIPVVVRSLEGGAPGRQLLTEPAPLVVAPPAVVNAGGKGFYRTSYDPAPLAAIAGSLGTLSESERAALLGDTWALVRAGAREVDDLLTLAAGLGTEVEPSTWEAVDQALAFLERAVDEADRAVLAARTRSLMGPLFERLGWEQRDGEDERTQVLRATLVRRLGTTGADASIQTEALARFDSGVVEGDLADAIVAVVNAAARPGDFAEMLRRFREAKDPQTEERYRLGICGVADVSRCVETFEQCFEWFRLQDAVFVIARLSASRVGGRAVWEGIAARWDEMLERIPLPMQFALAIGLTAQVFDAPFAERVVAFHRAHPLEAGQQRVEQALELLEASVRLADRVRPTLAQSLR